MTVHFEYEIDEKRVATLAEIEDAETRDMVEEVTEELLAELSMATFADSRVRVILFSKAMARLK